MQNKQLAKITKMIRKAVDDILYLSHGQEDLIDSTTNQANNPRDIARDQNDLKTACNRVASSVSDITKETLFVNMLTLERLGAAINAMQDAIDQLNSRSPARSSRSQTDAMAALNQTAAMLMNSLEQACNSQCSGTGMQSLMQKLSEMAQAQKQCNQGSQNMFPMPMPQAMSMAQAQAMQRLAAQQEAIRQSLQELTEQYGNPGNVLGRLDQLGKEMQNVVEDMQSNRFNRETVNRQERILSRLLDAQKSVNRRDYSRQRQARTADDIIRRGPSILNFGDSENEKLSEDIQKALSEKYPRRYENEIREYFKALSEDQVVE
jgi:hypothetical protein